MAKGNQTVDQLISFTAVENSQNPSSIFQQALQSHSLLHQSANMLHKQFPTLTRDQCKHIIMILKQTISGKLMSLIFPSLAP
jgi:hypothetical protein